MTMVGMSLCRGAVILFLVFLHWTKGSPQCNEKVADVVFLLDSSFSIWEKQFHTQLAFVKDLVNSFTIGPNNIRVGVVTFSTKVRLDVALNEHGEKRDLQAAIGSIQYMAGGTMTGDAIRFAHTHMFTAEKGSRPWAAHIVILITDGFSHDPAQTSMQASVARSKGLELFAVGVGSGVDDKELRAIATDPDDSHMFTVDSFDALKGIQNSLASETCHKPNTTDSKDQNGSPEDIQNDSATERCGGKPADVFFLLDGSSSIWRPDFREQVGFVSHLLGLFDLGPHSTRVAAAVYSDSVRGVLGFQHHQSLHSVRRALKRAPYLTGDTYTGDALHHVRTQGFANARKDVAHVIIVLTDGQSANTKRTAEEAQRARDQGIFVFAVGIGSQTDPVELMEMASDPDENFVFHVDDFGGLKNIKELLAIKTCDVKVPDYQGDQPVSDCRILTPTDVLFAYDSAAVSKLESDIITDAIRKLVPNIDSDHSDIVRFGLVRDNCYKGDNSDIKSGSKAEAFLTHLTKSHHKGLHTLLKRVRLHGYPNPHDVERSRADKVMVLFVGNKMADPVAVDTELQQLKFQGVRLLVVAVDLTKENTAALQRQANVPLIKIDNIDNLKHFDEQLFEKFCEIVSLRD